MVSKDTILKTLNILIPAELLIKNLAIDKVNAVLKRYLMLKTGRYNFASFDVEYYRLFNEIFKSKHDKCSHTTFESQVMSMVEKFLHELAVQLNVIAKKEKIKISADEVQRLMEVQSCLIKDFSRLPPSVYSLSRIGAMSTTSFKK